MLNPHLDTPESIARSALTAMRIRAEESKQHTLSRLVNTLTKTHKMHIDVARDAAAIAIADNEARRLDARFDVTSSTGTCVFATIDGQRAAISIAEIVQHFEIL